MKLTKEEMALLRNDRTAFLVKAYLACDSPPSTRECAALLGIGHTKCFRLMKRFGFGKSETPNETAFETPNETVKPRKIKVSNGVSETPNETAFETPNETVRRKKNRATQPSPLTRYKEIFAERYRELTEMEYYWSPAEIKSLQQLVEDKLAFSMKSKGNEPTPEALASSLDIFLRAIRDPWYLSHLSPTILNSKYNDIVNHIRNEHQRKPASNTATSRNQQNAHENEQLRAAIAERKRQRGEL